MSPVRNRNRLIVMKSAINRPPQEISGGGWEARSRPALYGIKPKKHLGQNFLTHNHYAKVMAEAANISEKDTVVEIGPGKGILTETLLSSRAKRVIAIEKDRELLPFLKEKFQKEIKNGKLKIINEDILKLTPLRYTLNVTRYKIIANIPYYITGEILRYFLTGKKQPKSITLMLQREVADRVVGKDGKESLLSISVKVYGEPKIVAKVGAGNFYPKPKVDSAIIQIDNISRNFFKNISEEKFFKILRAGFSHKRKVLSGNLKVFGKEKVAEAFHKIKLPPKTRAENVSFEQWGLLSLHLKSVAPTTLET